MRCRNVELDMPEGYKKNITICKNIRLPRSLQGIAIPKYDLILINEDLEYPELYVELHELNHILYPHKSEYEIRKISDFEYRKITGHYIDTASKYLEYIRKASQKKWN